MNKYGMGDAVWFAGTKQVQKWITCPDCQGKLYLRVILGDDSEVTIDCAGCSRGYEPPCGAIGTWEFQDSARQYSIEGMEIEGDTVYYKLPGRYRVPEEDLFPTQEEAQIRARELTEKRTGEEAGRLKRKEKDARTWAWHVTYHRGCIKRAERDLAYHTAKLAVAKERKQEASA